MFETIISSIETFARDTEDYQTARLAIAVLIRMISVWCGPDKVGPGANAAPSSPDTAQAPLPGFENYVVERFSPLVWSIPSAANFNAYDAQAVVVLYEIANLQREIIKKIGESYVERIKNDLSNAGAKEDVQNEYLRLLAASFEGPKKENG